MAVIAVLVPHLGGGGAERALVNLARGFAELGHAVDLVALTAAGEFRKEIDASVNLVDLGARRARRAVPGLVRYLRRRRPDCLLSAQDHVNLLAILARTLTGLPGRLVISLRANASAQLGGSPALLSAAVLRVAGAAYPHADAIVAVSQGVADDAATLLRLDRTRITVVANPVVTPELARLALEPVAHPWLVPGAAPVILGCGRLAPQKDFTTLIHAFAQLRSRQQARLVILGEGAERDRLARLAEELGIASDVAMPGFEPNPFRYMARCRVFALSSRFEGSPNVLVQALACGCAVVSTDCPSGPREILDGVSDADLVPVADAAALGAALERQLEHGAAFPGSRAPARFDYRFAARSYLEVCLG